MKKVIKNSYPIWREAKVIDTTDPEKLGRIQLKVYPELSEIPDGDCPWCFPHTGGVHGKSFGVPLVDQLITCVVWNKYWNEITFLPFNITNPTEHLFDDWKKNQKPKIVDMADDPEEEHMVVEEYEDGFTEFHDTKNNQHGFLHPKETFFTINKEGNVFFQSIKHFTFHNKDSDLIVKADSETGDVYFETMGNYEDDIKKNSTLHVEGEQKETVDKAVTETYKDKQTTEVTGDVTQTYKAKQTTEVTGDVSMTGKANWKVSITGNTEIKTKGNTKIETTGNTDIKGTGPMKIEGSATIDIKGTGPVTVESSAMTTVKGSSMVIVDAPIMNFKGMKSQGTVPPSGSGVLCAMPICPPCGCPHVG
jgi:hypothetical protein